MRFRKFTPHDNIPDTDVNENNYYTNPDAIDGSDLFDKKIPIESPTDTQVVNTSDTDFEYENPPEIVVDLLPEVPEPQNDPVETPQEPERTLKQPPEITHNQPDTTLQPEVITNTPIEQSPQDSNTNHEIRKDTQPPVQTRAATSKYNLRQNPQPGTYQDNLLFELSKNPALARFLNVKQE